MVAPLVAAAGIAAAGQVVGGATGGKGAKKAAKIQAQSTAQQIAANNARYDQLYEMNRPAIEQGAAADSRSSALLNLGGDATAAREGLDAYKASTGYQTRLDEGTDAITANAYARGMGDSGATMKALVRFGQGAASAEFDKYLGQLGQVSNVGAGGRAAAAGVGMQTTAANNQANQTSADARGNSAIINANAWNQATQNLFRLGSQAAGGGFQSSYGGGGMAAPGWPAAAGGMPPAGAIPGYGGGYWSGNQRVWG